ncbi:MAG: hypothetical protein RLZZ540_2427 [Bacteroidota bacterium]|jgi:hypothetical protein
METSSKFGKFGQAISDLKNKFKGYNKGADKVYAVSKLFGSNEAVDNAFAQKNAYVKKVDAVESILKK